MPAAGESVDDWNRVELTREGEMVVVTCGDARHELPIGADLPELVLVNDGLATSFCSLFVED